MNRESGPRVGCLWLGEPDLGGWYTEEEFEAVRLSVRHSMDWTVGFAPHDEIRTFEEKFALYVGVQHALAVNGAGPGLDIVLKALRLQPGDEVISCAINFPGTHLSVIGHGGCLILAEPDPHTLNICPVDVAKKINSRTRAIIVTHIAGLSADMDAIYEVAQNAPITRNGPPKIIVDAARACGGDYRGKKVGSQGWASVFSFQRKKLMTTLGEGGMVVTNDLDLHAALEEMRSFGMGRGWGSNYKMTKTQAAVGQIQLKRLDSMNAERVKRAQERTTFLAGKTACELPLEMPDRTHLYYLYSLTLPAHLKGTDRDTVIKTLKDRFGIEGKVVNAPTYEKNSLIREHTKEQKTPLADELGARILCLPLHPLMTAAQNGYVSEAFLEALADIQA